RGLAFETGVRRHDDFLHLARLEADKQLLQPQVLRANPLHRVEDAMEDVVTTTEAGPFEREDVEGLFDHADHRRVAARVSAEEAWVLLSDIQAGGSERNPRLHVEDGRGQGRSLLLWRAKHVVGEPLRRLRANAWEPVECLDQPG